MARVEGSSEAGVMCEVSGCPDGSEDEVMGEVRRRGDINVVYARSGNLGECDVQRCEKYCK
jgi:hypothetical protein